LARFSSHREIASYDGPVLAGVRHSRCLIANRLSSERGLTGGPHRRSTLLRPSLKFFGLSRDALTRSQPIKARSLLQRFVRARPKICWGGSARYPPAALEGQSFTHLREIDCAAFLALMNPGPKVIGPLRRQGTQSAARGASWPAPIYANLVSGAGLRGSATASRVLFFGFAPLDKYSPFAFLLEKVEHSLSALHRSNRNFGRRAVGSRPHQLPTALLNERRALHMAARGMKHRTVKTS